MEQTIAQFFPEPVAIRQGYETFFEGLTRIVGGQEPDLRTGESLQVHVREFLAGCDLTDFQNLSGAHYERNYLGRDAEGWEAIMMCWQQGHWTTIHGHPAFAAYNFASGHFRVEVFELDEAGRPRPVKTFEARGGEGFFAAGRPGTFDNHIHRITCLSETGHSLHVYWGDARRGVVYEA